MNFTALLELGCLAANDCCPGSWRNTAMRKPSPQLPAAIILRKDAAMITTHDDLPHPVPPYAYLRYKENWFFIIIDAENDVFGMAHFNCEPGHDRARFSCNLMIRQELFKYGVQVPFPANFAYSRQIGDDRLQARFIEAHKHIDLSLHSSDVDLDMSFLALAPTFDYQNSDAANPNRPTPSEIVSFGTHQEFHHQQQAMRISGTLKLNSGKSAGQTIVLKGVGYRDHSRAMRADNFTLKHVWTFLYFPSTLFGLMSLTGSLRPGSTSLTGYVHDADGTRSLGEMSVINHGLLPDKNPEQVEFKLQDVYGKPFTVIADIARRMGYVPLITEKPDNNGFFYNITENFAPATLKETGETGVSLVEIGHQTKKL